MLLYSLILALLLWSGGYTIYLMCNHGLAPNARLQQLTRYLVAAIVAVLPISIAGQSVFAPSIGLILTVSLAWMVTYPLSYHLTHRNSSPDYDNQIDIAVGIYLFGWLTGLQLLLPPAMGWLVGLIAFIFLMAAVSQWVYYLTCHAAIDASGMKMLQETHYNEIIEFVKSYSAIRSILVTMVVLVLVASCLWLPTSFSFHGLQEWWQWVAVISVTGFITTYLFKPNHGLFSRTGIIQLYLVVKEYVANNSRYIEEQQLRLNDLQIAPLHAFPEKPHSLLLVIGESASRDFMSAFSDVDVETTPWLSQLSKDRQHCVLFPNAYSCDIQTVPTLEKALTEYNQYDGGQFYSSCSIVDIAQKLGYRVHWYSNQGHLGAADTPITLVANTSEVARWTHQVLNQVSYDETLVQFLDEVDPSQNNLIVLHLKGSHFNYENRFPKECRQWGSPDDHDKTTNYKNTLHYTDSVLQKAFEYVKTKLNLQTMVYCSDHADVPDRHRQPNFGGFRDIRIPLMVWMDDEYITLHPERAQAIHDNSQRYWTNDLLYDLVCGLFDIRSNHFHEDNSLASPSYRFSREMLTAMDGKIHISEDAYHEQH